MMIDEQISLGVLRARLIETLAGADAQALDAPHGAALEALIGAPPVDLVVGYMRACWAAHEADAGVTDEMLERLVEACAVTMRYQFHGAGPLALQIRDAVRADLEIAPPRPPASDPPAPPPEEEQSAPPPEEEEPAP